MSVRKRISSNASGEHTAWEVDYRDNDGKRRVKGGFATKKAARDWAAETHQEVKQGIHTPASQSITVAEAADEWLDARRDGDALRNAVEPATLRMYKQHVETYIKKGLGTVRLGELTRMSVEGFADDMVSKYPRIRARKVLTTFKSIISHAVRKGHVARNVARDTSVQLSDREGGGNVREVLPESIPSRAGIRTIAAKLDELAQQSNPRHAKAWRRWRALILTAILTGMRASELRGLSWEYVNFDTGQIMVRQRADETGIIGKPKSKAGVRDIFIPPVLVALLKAWKLECPKEGNTNGLVFPNWKGNVENLANIHTRGWKPLLKKCGLLSFRFHDIRHYRASVLIADGANPKEVQTDMGHASITITMNLYAKLLKDDDGSRQDRAVRLAADVF